MDFQEERPRGRSARRSRSERAQASSSPTRPREGRAPRTPHGPPPPPEVGGSSSAADDRLPGTTMLPPRGGVQHQQQDVQALGAGTAGEGADEELSEFRAWKRERGQQAALDRLKTCLQGQRHVRGRSRRSRSTPRRRASRPRRNDRDALPRYARRSRRRSRSDEHDYPRQCDFRRSPSLLALPDHSTRSRRKEAELDSGLACLLRDLDIHPNFVSWLREEGITSTTTLSMACEDRGQVESILITPAACLKLSLADQLQIMVLWHKCNAALSSPTEAPGPSSLEYVLKPEEHDRLQKNWDRAHGYTLPASQLLISSKIKQILK